MKVNSYTISNFTLSPEGLITTNIGLSEGLNTVEVKGKNESGEVVANTTITYSKAVISAPAPTVTIIQPTGNTFTTYDPSIQLRAQIANVAGRQNVKLLVNGTVLNNFEYEQATGTLNSAISLREGANEIIVNAENETGSDAALRIVIKETKPCPQPSVAIVEPASDLKTTESQSQVFRAEVTNIASSNQLRLSLNGNNVTSFTFTGSEISFKATLREGANNFNLVATNDCGSTTLSSSITFTPAPVIVTPCPKPVLTYTIIPVSMTDANHELSGSVTNISSRNDIIMTVDEKAYDGFQYVQTSGKITAKFRFEPGNHKVAITVKNECGQDAGATLLTIIAEEKPCGVRINPGNSDWQFCLVTPSGTFNRKSLTNDGFTYSGAATSLYIMPIAGGGDAIVNGQPYVMRSGQYYLFTGRLKVTVSTKNPGSMGQWSVCIESDTPPVYGNGNNRPKSPCEVEQPDTLKATPRVKKINNN